MVFLELVFMKNILYMNKSQRIQLTAETQDVNKYLKVRLEQDIDTLEFMSLKLDTKEIYNQFNSDYGVLIGRVTANGGIGIPNTKISIFIPLAKEDEENGDIVSIYPYKNPRDKNKEGKRYNLLPRVSKRNPETNNIKPQQAFGSLPIKEEFVTNSTHLEVYKKYYKYTTTTNTAGDYMIFGVPIGTQTVHMSCDITDIGEYSMTPAAMVTNLGYSPNLFTDNGTRIRPSNDLDDLPNIETQEITVDVIPFWGDTTNFDIGITRQDFRIRALLVNTFILFGSVFTDGDNSMWGEKDKTLRQVRNLYQARNVETYSMFSKRIGHVTEKIYYYPTDVTDEEINNGEVNPINDMKVLDPSEYSIYKRDGDFVFIINCNRNKIITNEQGQQVPISNDSSNGVFTKFRGFITFEITPDDIPMNFTGDIGVNTTLEPYRYRLKFPQHADVNNGFDRPIQTGAETKNDDWRKQHSIFEANKFYSVSKFHSLIHNEEIDRRQFKDGLQPGEFLKGDGINKAYGVNKNWNVGIIITGDYGFLFDEYENAQYEFPENSPDGFNIPYFGSNWMNLSIHLPQVGNLTNGYKNTFFIKSADHFHQVKKNDGDYNGYFLNNNDQDIAANQVNTKWFARSDLNWTDIIEVPPDDIRKMGVYDKKGFNNTELPESLEGVYRNGHHTPIDWSTPCPYEGGKIDGNPLNSEDPRTYFYKGFGDANCIEFLYYLGLIT